MTRFQGIFVVAIVLLVGCESPTSTVTQPSAALVVEFSSSQLGGIEASRVRSGTVEISVGRVSSQLELGSDGQGTWKAVLDRPIAPGATLSARLYSGDYHTGLLLFQGTETSTSGLNSGPMSLRVSNVSYFSENFIGKVAVLTNSEVYVAGDNAWFVFVTTYDVSLDYEIVDGTYSVFEIDTVQNTNKSTKTLKSTGSVDRNGLLYTLTEEKQYDTQGNQIQTSAPTVRQMVLSNSGDSLMYATANSPVFLRQ